MLHYELQPATSLLFLAITHPDLPQSAAFAFLNAFKQARHGPVAIATGPLPLLPPLALLPPLT